MFLLNISFLRLYIITPFPASPFPIFLSKRLHVSPPSLLSLEFMPWIYLILFVGGVCGRVCASNHVNITYSVLKLEWNISVPLQRSHQFIIQPTYKFLKIKLHKPFAKVRAETISLYNASYRILPLMFI